MRSQIHIFIYYTCRNFVKTFWDYCWNCWIRSLPSFHYCKQCCSSILFLSFIPSCQTTATRPRTASVTSPARWCWKLIQFLLNHGIIHFCLVYLYAYYLSWSWTCTRTRLIFRWLDHVDYSLLYCFSHGSVLSQVRLEMVVTITSWLCAGSGIHAYI